MMMVMGFVLFSFFLALADGAYGDIIAQFINSGTGEIQVHYKDYLEAPKIYKSINKYQDLQRELGQYEGVISSSARIKGSALSFANKYNRGVEILGINFHDEMKSTNLKTRMGRDQRVPQGQQVFLGKSIAKHLNVNIGDEIILISSGADGSVANDAFEVVGIMKNDSPSLDDGKVLMPLATAQDFFAMPNRVHEIMLRVHGNIEKITRQLSAYESNLTFSPWQEVEKDFYKAMQADRKGDSIARMIIMIVVVLGVLNTILMSIMERTREFGVLKAIGTSPIFIFKTIVLETVFISLISIVIGILLSFCLNYYFSIHGISFGTAIDYGGFTFTEMKAAINLNSYLFPSVVIFLSSFIISLYPGIRAARTIPVEAMRL